MPIIAGNINPESDLLFLNVWRPILRQMMGYYTKKKGVARTKVVEAILSSTQDQSTQSNKIDVVSDIFGLTEKERSSL